MQSLWAARLQHLDKGAAENLVQHARDSEITSNRRTLQEYNASL
jgi:hypothetical protein